MNEVVTITDHAARQSDRWLFIAILVILLIASVVFWRWIIKDRDKLGARLTDVTDRHIDAHQKLIEVVARNNEVVAQNTRVLFDVNATLTYCKTRNQNQQ